MPPHLLTAPTTLSPEIFISRRPFDYSAAGTARIRHPENRYRLTSRLRARSQEIPDRNFAHTSDERAPPELAGAPTSSVEVMVCSRDGDELRANRRQLSPPSLPSVPNTCSWPMRRLQVPSSAHHAVRPMPIKSKNNVTLVSWRHIFARSGGIDIGKCLSASWRD